MFVCAAVDNVPTKAVDVTDVKPANVVELAPNAIAVVPIVVELFVNLAFATDAATNCEPSIVLLVRVCVPVFKTMSSSDPKGPAIHLSFVVSHNNEPDINDAAVASLTTKPALVAPVPLS